MKVLYSVLCEDAHARQDGRLDVHGVFHQLYAPGFPAQQSELTLVTAIEWEPHERGQIAFSVDLLDPGRSPVLTIRAETDVHERDPHGGAPRSEMVMPLTNVVFPAEGRYTFELDLGGARQPLAQLHLIRLPHN